MYTFPGIGLGAVMSGAKRITDRMLYQAARTLSLSVPEERIKNKQVANLWRDSMYRHFAFYDSVSRLSRTFEAVRAMWGLRLLRCARVG